MYPESMYPAASVHTNNAQTKGTQHKSMVEQAQSGINTLRATFRMQNPKIPKLGTPTAIYDNFLLCKKNATKSLKTQKCWQHNSIYSKQYLLVYLVKFVPTKINDFPEN